MASIELKNIVKDFGDVKALENLNLSIDEGEFIVILGPSGAGKTTTLKLIAGIEELTSGQLLIGGCDAASMKPADRDITMVFETYALYPHMTVWENMATPLRGRGSQMDAAAIDARVQKIARILRMEEYMTRLPSQLSGGQKQRVAMGRAMVREPKIFLLDEPLNHVDAKIREELRKELHLLRHTIKSTVVYVTHDYIEALSLGQRIAIINKGRIEQIGTPWDVYFRPANLFVASHIGQPEVNRFVGRSRLDGSSVHIDFPDLGHEIVLPSGQFPNDNMDGQEIVVGLRPQHVRLSETRDERYQLPAEIVIRENLRTELDLVLRTGKVKLTALESPEKDLPEGQQMFLHLPEKHLMFFSKNTESRIDYQPGN